MSAHAQTTYALSTETGFNIELCKMALERSKNHLGEAKRLLSKWGNKSVSPIDKKSFGLVRAFLEKEFDAASIAKITCADPVFAMSREFSDISDEVVQEIVRYEAPYISEAALPNIEKEFGSKINFKFDRLKKSSDLSLLTVYNHRNEISVIVETEASNEFAFNNRAFRLFSFNLAMHIAAFNPISIDKASLPEEITKAITEETTKELLRVCKPMTLWPTVIEGKLSKYADKRSLVNQVFIRNNTETVNQVLKQISDSLASEIKINKFIRYDMEE